MECSDNERSNGYCPLALVILKGFCLLHDKSNLNMKVAKSNGVNKLANLLMLLMLNTFVAWMTEH